MSTNDKTVSRTRKPSSSSRSKTKKSENRDPITGEPGSHPVGTAVGAVAGGAAAGAAVGTVAGPVGTIAGAAVGAVIGGLAGKGVAEAIDPTAEDAYWREHHGQQSYAADRRYEDYQPAYRAGYEGYAEWGTSGKSFDERESDIRSRYETSGASLDWETARPASRAAWDRLENTRGRHNGSDDVRGSGGGSMMDRKDPVGASQDSVVSANGNPNPPM